MKVELISIGNSRGIRIPKPIIEECGFGKIVELRVEHKQVVISAERSPREGWEEAFAAAGSSAKDELLLDFENEFDQKEWRW
ncbi:MAG: AbrB/MazE/SpoVT family DNA-binding domain-containing protein [Acidobacteriia bacterium]|nr:AbrB/MazE/SpoVT family DNA-binding domain-containing protein [Terriglobia bacterium]